jgi:hypothetical protein
MSEDRTVISKFKYRASRAVKDHAELLLAVHNKRNERSLQSLLAEQLVMSVAVVWEGFLTDLLITYAALDSRKASDSLRERILKSARERFGNEAAKTIRFALPKKLSKARIAALFDPKGWNFSFSTADLLSQRANELLVAQYAKKFTLDAEDMMFLQFLVTMRNYLGHRSPSSRDVLTEVIAKLGAGRNTPFHGVFTDVGSYLKKKDTVGNTRAVLIVNRLIEIADKV